MDNVATSTGIGTPQFPSEMAPAGGIRREDDPVEPAESDDTGEVPVLVIVGTIIGVAVVASIIAIVVVMIVQNRRKEKTKSVLPKQTPSFSTSTYFAGPGTTVDDDVLVSIESSFSENSTLADKVSLGSVITPSTKPVSIKCPSPVKSFSSARPSSPISGRRSESVKPSDESETVHVSNESDPSRTVETTK